jgi:hypothetical protein
MNIKINCRLAGTPQEYYTARITNAKGEIVAVHTGKSFAYVKRMTLKYK